MLYMLDIATVKHHYFIDNQSDKFKVITKISVETPKMKVIEEYP